MKGRRQLVMTRSIGSLRLEPSARQSSYRRHALLPPALHSGRKPPPDAPGSDEPASACQRARRRAFDCTTRQPFVGVGHRPFSRAKGCWLLALATPCAPIPTTAVDLGGILRTAQAHVICKTVLASRVLLRARAVDSDIATPDEADDANRTGSTNYSAAALHE
eukprot:361070-Chlamydomonas_euryale.AAC.5